MKTNNVIYIIIVCILIGAALFVAGYHFGHKKDNVSLKSDTVYVTTTDKLPKLLSSKPLYLYSYIVKHKRDTAQTFSHSQENDTIRDTIPIPITQNVYKGRNYTAYVSGFHQSLDSISVTEKIINNTIVKKRSRWNIGIMAGYGITYKGLTPYVGVGVVYNLFK